MVGQNSLKYFLGLVLLGFTLNLQADSPTLAQRLSDMQQFQATFHQTAHDDRGQLIQESEGKVWVSRGNKFRIETYSPFLQIIVSDGTNFWTYDADLEQVVVKPLVSDVKQIPILLFGNPDQSVLEEYEVSQLETEKSAADAYLLEPQSQESLFEVLTLGFSKGEPTYISLRDSLSQTTRIEFSETNTTLPIDEHQFGFKLPEGVDLIDDR